MRHQKKRFDYNSESKNISDYMIVLPENEAPSSQLIFKKQYLNYSQKYFWDAKKVQGSEATPSPRTFSKIPYEWAKTGILGTKQHLDF